MNKKDKLLNLILPIITLLCIVIFWAVASAIIKSDLILPGVKDTLSAFIKLFADKTFYISFLMTLLRSVLAFLISFILSGILAFLTYKYKYAGKVISPIISIIRTLPTIAIVLLLLFWTNSFIAPIIVTILVVMPTTYTSILNSLNSVDKDIIEMCATFGVSGKDTLRKVYIPGIAPAICLTIGSGLALNLKLMVAAEVLSQTARSIGLLLNTAKVYFEVPTMLALVLVTVITGVIIESVFNILSKKAGKWQ